MLTSVQRNFSVPFLTFGATVTPSETEIPPARKDVFCRILDGEIPQRFIADSETMTAVLDIKPVSPGHILIFPKRHFASFFDINAKEWQDLFQLLFYGKYALEKLAKQPNDQKPEGYKKPDGYNIGINDLSAAGQTEPHLHVHLIPRYNGDMEKPEGGIRGVIPEKQKYPKTPSAEDRQFEGQYYQKLTLPNIKAHWSQIWQELWNRKNNSSN